MSLTMHVLNTTTAVDPDQYYGYVPTEWLGIVAIVLFSIILFAEFVQGIAMHSFLQIIPMIGTIGEIIGWAFRLKSSFTPEDKDPFIGQLVCLIITPNCMLLVKYLFLF